MIRRHTRTADGEHHYGPAVGVVSGNFVTGRRRGTVDGIDFGATGSGEKEVLTIICTARSSSWLISFIYTLYKKLCYKEL